MKSVCASLLLILAIGWTGLLAAQRVAGDSGLFIFPDSSERRIREQELLDLDARQLWQSRNEIFARRGYRFRQDRARDFFLKQPYYEARSESVTLNDIERANIALIKRFEVYLKDYPEAAFEATYEIPRMKSVTDQGVIVRDCPEHGCHEMGRLYEGCTVESDFRMNKEDWIFLRSSQCGDNLGPADGYVPKSSLVMIAG